MIYRKKRNRKVEIDRIMKGQRFEKRMPDCLKYLIFLLLSLLY